MSTNPGHRNSYLQTAIRHSSKIYEFFGFTPGNTPPLSRLSGGDNTGAQDLTAQDLASRDEGSANGYVLNGPTHRSRGKAPEGPHQVNGAITHLKPPPLVIQKKVSRHRTWCRALIQDFGPIWFTFSMDTALLALLVQVLPHPYHPDFLQPLSTVLLILSLALFVVTVLLVLTRLLWFRLSAVYELVAVPVESKSPTTPQILVNPSPPQLASSTGTSILTLAYLPTALLTLVAAATVHAATLPSLRPALPIALYAVFWVGLALTIATTLLTLTNLFAHPHPGRRTAEGRYLRPMALLNSSLSLTTISLPASLLVTKLLPIGALSPSLAPALLLFALLLLGTAFLLASAAFAVLVHELLLVTGWPQTPTVFFMVAPPGQAAAGLLLVGEAVMVVGPIHGMRTATAEAVNVVCVMLALLLLGMAVLWLLLGLVGVLRRGRERWSPLWNGVMFPVGTVALAAARLGTGLGERAFSVAAVVLVVCCAVLWVVNLGFTLVGVVAGRVLVVRKDPREEEEEEVKRLPTTVEMDQSRLTQLLDVFKSKTDELGGMINTGQVVNAQDWARCTANSLTLSVQALFADENQARQNSEKLLRQLQDKIDADKRNLEVAQANLRDDQDSHQTAQAKLQADQESLQRGIDALASDREAFPELEEARAKLAQDQEKLIADQFELLGERGQLEQEKASFEEFQKKAAIDAAEASQYCKVAKELHDLRQLPLEESQQRLATAEKLVKEEQAHLQAKMENFEAEQRQALTDILAMMNDISKKTAVLDTRRDATDEYIKLERDRLEADRAGLDRQKEQLVQDRQAWETQRREDARELDNERDMTASAKHALKKAQEAFNTEKQALGTERTTLATAQLKLEVDQAKRKNDQDALAAERLAAQTDQSKREADLAELAAEKKKKNEA
ncbi:voltage-dependent anion channel-domain-containing protein [Podospora conica]|nr:voltage-dependent anion channel-domain-containing protein [Schizothecium conicum]